MSLGFSQLVLTVLALLYYSSSRPLFTFTEQVYDYSLAKALNDSNITLYLEGDGYYSGETAVNPYEAYMARHNRIHHHGNFMLDSTQRSKMTIYQVDEFLMMLFPSSLAMLFVFMSVRAIDSGQLEVNATYGDHGVRDNMFTEVSFWVFVIVEHYVFYQIMASPVHLAMIFVFSITTCREN